MIYEFAETYNCNEVIFARDLNIVFRHNEMKNRLFTKIEKKTAKATKDAGLTDCWDNPTFTWRRANTDTFFCLDRIFISQ